MAFGQTSTGTIIGHITDASGAVLPGVEVTALNPEKRIASRTVSDEQGIYRIFYLGRLTTSSPFRKLVSRAWSGVARNYSNETLAIDLQMNVGSVVEKMDAASVA